MCTLDPAIGWLTGAGIAIALAIGFILAAAIANNSFWGAGGSPALMLLAAASSAGAVITLKQAQEQISVYFQCMGAPAECLDQLSNLQMALDGLIAVLGIQATAAGTAALSAWIPWIGSVPMYPIAGALFVQALLIPTTIAFAYELINCAEQSRRAASSTLPLIVTVGIELLIAWALIYVPRRVRRRRAAALSGHNKF